MKILKYLSASLLATVALSIGIVSCGDKDDDFTKVEPEKPKPVVPTITKMLPTKIVEIAEKKNGDKVLYKGTTQYEYTYNDKNQMVTTAETQDGRTDKYTLTYDESGKLKTQQTADQKEAYNYSYNESTGMVKEYYGSNSNSFDRYYIDNKGNLASFEDKELSRKETWIYNETNSLQRKDAVSTSIGEKETETMTITDKIAVSLHTNFNPFVAVATPQWAQMTVLDRPMYMKYFCGSNIPATVTDNRNFVTTDKDGKELHNSTINKVSTITVLKKDNNLPTEISVAMIETGKGDAGRGEEYTFTHTITYSITYQPAK